MKKKNFYHYSLALYHLQPVLLLESNPLSLISNSIECTKSMHMLWLTPFVLKYTCEIYLYFSGYSIFTYCYVVFHYISQFIHSTMDGHLGFQFFVIYK